MKGRGLTPAHQGYRYQDIFTAYFLASYLCTFYREVELCPLHHWPEKILKVSILQVTSFHDETSCEIFLQITLYSYCILFGSEFCTFQRKSKNTQVEKCQFNSPRIVALASAGRPGCQTRKKIKSLDVKSNSRPPFKGAKMQQLGSLIFAMQPSVCQCQWCHLTTWCLEEVQKCCKNE